MDPDVRLYTMGDLIEDLHEHSLSEWKADAANGMTWRAAREGRIERVDIHMNYTLTGTAWIYVEVRGKRSSWSRDYAYKAWVRPGNTFELAAVV
jgi:hypothetical protein